jgi:glycosyltransferase involved in cell wall biosynthesis
MKKLAIVTTHPIQYNAPFFRLLKERGNVVVKIFYTWEQAKESKYDPGFGKDIKWDLPLLDGYDYTFVKNTSPWPGSHNFLGIINPSLGKELIYWSPDAILVFGWPFYSNLKVLAHFKNRIPVLFRGDSTLLDDNCGLKSFIRSIILKWVFRHIDKALYVGKNNKEYFLKYGLKESQLIFAPHVVDNERFEANAVENKKKAYAWRQSLGIKDNDRVFLFCGKLIAKKNPRILLEAFKELNLANTHLLFVGDGLLKEQLKKEALGNVHFIDFQNQEIMPVVYLLGDVFVLPSQGPGETWGLAVNEAMACGLSVLVSDKCGCAEDLVKDGVNGYIFESNNLDDLVEKMNLLALKCNLPLMGEESFKIINDYAYDNLCNNIEKTVQGLQ